MGLKTDPINSRVNGKMLGNGIYTTNVMTKAAYYCFKRKGPGFILMCEVALGEMFEVPASEPISNG